MKCFHICAAMDNLTLPMSDSTPEHFTPSTEDSKHIILSQKHEGPARDLG